MNNKIIVAAIVVIIIVAAAGYVLLSSEDSPDEGRQFDGTLEIYGNVNGDMSVDGDDLSLLNSYLDAIAEGQSTDGIEIDEEFGDVDRDGRINASDAERLESILNRVEGTPMHLLDGNGNEKSITIRDEYVLASDYTTNAELVNILGWRTWSLQWTRPSTPCRTSTWPTT